MAENDEDAASRAGRGLKNYAKYTGLAFQMMAIIGIFAYAGFKIDEAYDNKPQWVTALFCVIGVCISIFQTIRSLK